MKFNPDAPIPYGKQEITAEDIETVIAVLKSDFLTQGPQIELFEKKFAEYVGAKYAVAYSNATAALHGAAHVLGVGPKDKVIVTSNTFAASANCVRYCQGDVHFVDIDPENFLLDLAKVKKLLESHPPKTFKGIIPVDFAGHPVAIQELKKLADQHQLWILEDACHAPGAEYLDEQGQWQKVGNGVHSNIAIFSFHPVKHIATGEGGMATTNDPILYEKLKNFRTHGIFRDASKFKDESPGGWYYELHDLGYNYRLSDIQAALGISQLKKAPLRLKRRRELAKNYDESLQGLDLLTPKVSPKVRHAYHLYVIQTPRRKELFDYLREKKIYTQVHYIPVHRLHYYQNLGWKKGDFPVCENYYEHALSLPMYPQITDEEQQYVIQSLRDFYV